MPAIQILFEADHKARADTLANSLAAAALSDPIDKKPVKVAGLKTLIFWGHGSHTGLCGQTARDIIRLIKDWKGLNDGLDTVEIITCNARHYYDEWLEGTKPEKHLKSILTHIGSDKKIDNSIAKQIKRGLKYSIYPSIRKIRLLSMPQSGRGPENIWSILYWDAATASWCYVTGASEKIMFEIGYNIKQTKKMPPDPAAPYGKPRVGDFKTKLAAARIDFPAADYSDVVAGDLTTLRTILVDVN